MKRLFGLVALAATGLLLVACSRKEIMDGEYY